MFLQGPEVPRELLPPSIDPRLDRALPQLEALRDRFIAQLVHVAELWRFPVKSMGGERLVEVEVRADGLAGDRLVHVRSGAGRVLVARAYETESSPPYWMWVQLLRGYARDDGVDALLALGADAAQLLSLVPELAPGGFAAAQPARDHEAARFRLYDALVHEEYQIRIAPAQLARA